VDECKALVVGPSPDGDKVGAYTRSLLSSTLAVSDTKYTLNTP